MDASFFIAGRLRFKGNIAVVSIAISFLVMIIAVAVSSGFRHEVRNGLSSMSGDVRLMPPAMSYLDENEPIERDPAYLPYVQDVQGVRSIEPAVYRAGIVKVFVKHQTQSPLLSPSRPALPRYQVLRSETGC